MTKKTVFLLLGSVLIIGALMGGAAFAEESETDSDEGIDEGIQELIIPDLIEEIEIDYPEYYEIYFNSEDELHYKLEAIANLINRHNYLLELNNQLQELQNIRLHNQNVYMLNQLVELASQHEEIESIYSLLYEEMKKRDSTQVETAHGVITIDHDITLGEMIIFISIGLLVITLVMKWFISRLWG